MNSEPIIKSIKTAHSKKLFIANKNSGTVTLNYIGQDKSIYLFKVYNTSVHINGKINNFYLEDCSGVNIYCDSIVNTLDIYNSGKVFVNTRKPISTINAEQVEKFVIIMGQEKLDDTQFVVSCVYELLCYSECLKQYISVFHSMFRDRYQTTFEENKCNTIKLPTDPVIPVTFGDAIKEETIPLYASCRTL